MTVKQKRLQSAFIFSSRSALCAALCLFGTDLGQAQMSTPGAVQDETHLELVGGAGGKPGIYVAGIVITMAPGSHTYWKMPGDAGVPPVFDFSGSQNVRSAQVRYPAPRRITEDGLEAFGYLDDVTFPIEVVAADPAKPALLKAEVAYAVCNRICIPARGHGTVTLAPGMPGAGVAIDAALASVPVPASPAEHADLAVTREPGAAKLTWVLTWHGAKPVDDIFADAPEGTYFATRKTGPETWRLVVEQSTQTAGAESVTLTLARAARPLLMEEKLDTGVATR